ncbi:hypothetical protein BGZ76_007945 [Entomortierella beljakovae]|nr:hypothetical protein BGZ76_007945 [Entomortierella beljakovae]
MSNKTYNSSTHSLRYEKTSIDLKPLPQSHPPQASVDPLNALPFDNSILTISHRKDVNTLKAIIVGASITGLAFAIMMDRSGMDYQILERYTGQEPEMGSSISLGPPSLRLMEQLGLLEEIERVSKPLSGLKVVNTDGRKMGRLDGVEEDLYGYPYRVMTWSALHKILLSRVPVSHLHRGKHVVETLQNPNGVSCKCSDGSTYYGDIIVGADGAQSQTRERMYKELHELGKLPDSDMDPYAYEHTCILGTSAKLDPAYYPINKKPDTEFQVVYSKGTSHTFWYLPIPDNRISWGIHGTLSTPKYKQRAILPSNAIASIRPHILRSPSSSSTPTYKVHDDWLGSADNLDFENLGDLLDAKCPVGPGTIRDFIKNTPKDVISQVDLEERYYKTWYHDRIVLVGDACHQHLLVGGQGAMQCLLDAVCLVNLLHEMEYNSLYEITKAFKKYQTKRSVIVKTTILETGNLDKVFHGQGILVGMMRRLVFNSFWSFNMRNDKFNCNQPQLSFLPFVEDRGSCKGLKQKPSERSRQN